jgi:small subunit ribosomal protein S3
MGQKVSVNGFRLGITRGWDSRWYAKSKKEFGELLLEDQKIRKFIKGPFAFAGIPKIEIERQGEAINIIVHAARPGILIGRKGAKVEKLRGDLERMTSKTIKLDIREINKPELSGQLVAENVADQLRKRSGFRRTIRKAVQLPMEKGAKGVKIQISGRLGGAEMARRETVIEGSIPLHTLDADIDYGLAEARTTAGKIGVKCWVYRGLVDRKQKKSGGDDRRRKKG